MDHLKGKWKWPLPQAHSLSFVTYRFFCGAIPWVFPGQKGHVDDEVDVSILINDQTKFI